MPTCETLDTFPSFLELWNEIQHSSTNVQIKNWLERYMSQWPELLKKQLDDYANLQEDWRVTASERIFPSLDEKLPLMQIAHDNLLNICVDVYDRARKVIGYNNDLVCVIYAGLGCGAGWATDYDNKPAILFGLENIAEEGWQEQDILTRLMAHELGHLVHFEWRKQADLANQESPWWQLYTEGFAQRCESMILGKPSWHMQPVSDNQWLEWCKDNLDWLAKEFLRHVDLGKDIRTFFGSWFDICGQKQTGYFLGHELIKNLQKGMSLREVALLSDIESHLRPLLIEIAG